MSNLNYPGADWRWVAGFSLALIFMVVAVRVKGQELFATSDSTIEPVAIQDNTTTNFVAPAVFQAAGPNIASIQGTITDFRGALGDPVNNGVLEEREFGRREINWDGGVPPSNVTTPPITPFDTFLNNRGARFTTPGIGLSQAPVSGGPQNGLVGLFGNATYATSFRAFSALRLFTPVGINITDTLFFVAGSNGDRRAVVTGFGAIFTDVDQPDGSGPGNKHGNRKSSTLMQFFGADGSLLFSSFVPASPGDGGFSFFGIKFNDPRIASVRIIAGNVAPGPDDDKENDVVMMDDFIYGEPHKIQ
ncbi:MAG TPA: hypothetical protein VFP64_08395 [Pyrinomonadaceae bacterium]|nr:hypothetical protein [Pyrinomonadaceae bacterium]